MKLKLLIIGMLLLSLVVLSGCATDHRIATKKCLEEVAEDFCEERDCVVQSVHYKNIFLESSFNICRGEWREYDNIVFTDKEIESCEVKP